MALNYLTESISEINTANTVYSDEKLKEYIKEISKYNNLTAEEEQELARKAQNGDIKSKQKLIEANLKLVITIARKVIHSSKIRQCLKLYQSSRTALKSPYIYKKLFQNIQKSNRKWKIPVSRK